MNWIPLIWLAIALAILRVLEQWIHRHLQGTALLLTGDQEIAVVLYALPLLPGVILHELSHALAAVMLGVKVAGISLRPKVSCGHIQLGVVPVENTDVARASLIGLAPLLTGNAVILLVGYLVFGIGALRSAIIGPDLKALLASLATMIQAPDAWIWAYVVFTISNTMMPSRSDRQAWLPLLLFLLVAAGLIWLIGIGPVLAAELKDSLTLAVHWLATMCTLTILVDAPFITLITLTERVLQRLKGVRVEY